MEKRHLIIFERSMNSRFIELAKHHNLSYSLVNMTNSFNDGFFSTLINRIRKRRKLIDKINEQVRYIKMNNIKTVYLSNTEGYIGYTGGLILKKTLPDVNLIALQHGIFPLEYSLATFILKKGLNKLTFFFFGLSIFGQGFGSLLVNKYIVYGEPEKSFLVKRKKWKEFNVEVNLKFLKSYLTKSKKTNCVKNSNSVIFLLQSLSASKLCSPQEEHVLINKTLIYLSNKYTKVLVKGHPQCKSQISGFNLPYNVEVIDDMTEGFSIVNSAYSFFSTALIDAKFFDLDIYAVFSSKIKIKKSVYNVFDNVINFESEINE